MGLISRVNLSPEKEAGALGGKDACSDTSLYKYKDTSEVATSQHVSLKRPAHREDSLETRLRRA